MQGEHVLGKTPVEVSSLDGISPFGRHEEKTRVSKIVSQGHFDVIPQFLSFYHLHAMVKKGRLLEKIAYCWMNCFNAVLAMTNVKDDIHLHCANLV